MACLLHGQFVLPSAAVQLVQSPKQQPPTPELQLPAFNEVTRVKLQEQGFRKLSKQLLVALERHIPERFTLLQQVPPITPMGA